MQQLGYQVRVITNGVHYLTGENLLEGKKLFEHENVLDGVVVTRVRGVSSHRSSKLRRILSYLQFGLLALVASLRLPRPDVVFVGSDPLNVSLVGLLVAKIRNARFVLDERDLNPETALALEVISPGVMSTLLERISQFIRNGSDHIVAATPGLSEYLKERTASSKVSLLLNADYFFDVTPDRTPREAGSPVVVGYAGGLGMANDVLTMLRAAVLLSDHSSVRFMIMGAGERLDYYKEMVRSEGLTNVDFIPPKPRGQARQTIAGFDIGIQPLRAHPHFEMTLTSKMFEYQSLGVPVIFAGAGDGADLLAKSGGGVVVPPEDPQAMATAILQLAESAERRERLGQEAMIWYRSEINVEAGTKVLRHAIEAISDD